MELPKVLILGKLPPPYMGPAIATRILLNSSLNEQFQLLHLDTRVNKNIASMGRWSLGKAFKNVGIYFKLWGMLLRHRPKVVLIPISQTTMGFLKDAIFILIAILCFRKIVVQLRGSNFKNWLNKASGITRLYVKVVLSGTAGVIVLGNNLKHLFEQHFKPHQIFVVPNGADYTFPARKSSSLRVLYFANFLPSKGFEDVLGAMRLLKEKGITNFEFHAVGAWDNNAFEEQSKAFVKEHQLSVNFHAPMSGEEKFQQFADADIFVFTPRAPEGHPWVVVEAMAAGLPIIATDQGAIVESVIDGENGYIVPTQAPEQIAEKLEQLLHNNALRQQMGTASKQQHHAHFTEAKMVANMAGVWQQFINKS